MLAQGIYDFTPSLALFCGASQRQHALPVVLPDAQRMQLVTAVVHEGFSAGAHQGSPPEAHSIKEQWRAKVPVSSTGLKPGCM